MLKQAIEDMLLLGAQLLFLLFRLELRRNKTSYNIQKDASFIMQTLWEHISPSFSNSSLVSSLSAFDSAYSIYLVLTFCISLSATIMPIKEEATRATCSSSSCGTSLEIMHIA